MDSTDKTVTMAMTEYKNIEDMVDAFKKNKIMISRAVTPGWGGGRPYQKITYEGKDEAVKELTEVNANLAVEISHLVEECKALSKRNTPKDDFKSRVKFLFKKELTYEA